MRRRRGFTLIEMMIVVVIIGVLSAIAIPTFQSYLLRSQTSEAVVFLGEIRQRQEAYRAEHGQFCSVSADPGSDIAAGAWAPATLPTNGQQTAWGTPANWNQLGAEPVAYGDGSVEAVRALAPEGVTVVADFVGGVLDVTTAVLADGGRHASIADDSVLGAGGRWMWVRPDAGDLARLATLVDDGALRIDVEETFAFEDAAAAYARSQEGHVHGKLVIEVAGD